MSIKRKLAAGITGAAIIAGMSLFGAAPAQAAIGDCISGQFCLAPGVDFTGTGYGNVNSVSAVPSYINDQSRSAYNHGNSCNINAFRDAGYAPANPLYVPLGAAFGNLSNKPYPGGGNWALKISSFRFC